MFWILSKRLYCFYPSSAFCQSGIGFDLFCKVNHLNKYGIRPPCPPCHLFSRSIDWRAILCARLKPFYPLSRLLNVVFCMSAVPYYLLLHFLPFGERPLAFKRFIGELSRTFRPCVPSSLPAFRCLYSTMFYYGWTYNFVANAWTERARIIDSLKIAIYR